METAVIVVLLVLGLIMPLFWIVGAATSVGYVVYTKGMDLFAKNSEAEAFHGHLGVTMADGGAAIDKEKEKK
jgi:hypothetical protein